MAVPDVPVCPGSLGSVLPVAIVVATLEGFAGFELGFELGFEVGFEFECVFREVMLEAFRCVEQGFGQSPPPCLPPYPAKPVGAGVWGQANSEVRGALQRAAVLRRMNG